MRIGALSLALTFLLPPTIASGSPPTASAFDDVTLARLERALSCVNLSISDLGWDKRPISDDFRLTCVNEMLDHPLLLADRAVRAEREFADDPVASAAAVGRWLDALPPQFRTASEDRALRMATVKPERFRGAPEGAASLLALLFNAYLEASRLREQAMAPLSAEERKTLLQSGARLYTEESDEDWDMTATLAAAKKVDISLLVSAERVLAGAAVRVQAQVYPHPVPSNAAGANLDPAISAPERTNADPARPVNGAAPAREKKLTEAGQGAQEGRMRIDTSGWKTRSWTIDGVSVGLGGPGPDNHSETIVLDGGGDDLYTAGSVIVDIAGDDVYRGAGQGLFDVALVLDLAGNDTYVGKNFVQGGAAFGASLLIDVAGDDRYEADQCSQGAAFFGVGMLFDLAGSDTYRGARFVQGFGGTRGLGALSDLSGNDTYYAGGKYSHAPLLPENFQSLSQGFGFGLRGASASGGVGILADHAGNDVYSAEVFGQGASYWFSLGILVDSAGHDKYNLYQYGQGAGIHLSAGVLFDRAGNDAYSCNNGVAQGSGHDWGTGLLWDLAGDDCYQGSGMSQGGANANGIGMLVDRAGNDSYAGWNEKNQGDSFLARGTIGLGVLLDLAGRDRYTHGGRDGAIWTRGTVGVGSDTEDPPAPGDSSAAAKTP